MIKPPLIKLCFVIALLATTPVYADGQASKSGPNSVQGIAEREIARRNDQVARAQQAIAAGDKLMGVQDYENATLQYKAAADILADAPVTHNLRSAAVDRYCVASVKLAEQQIAEGNFAQAEATAKAVLASNYDPKCRGAITILVHLEEPGYYNKAITPKFHAKIEDVKQLFVEAEDFYNTGQLDKAMQRYNMILNIDKYNQAAREGQIKVIYEKNKYAEKARNETRADALWEVSKGWEKPVPKYGNKKGTVINTPMGASGTAKISALLNSLIIPKVEFKDATVREAIDFLKTKSRELDPDKKGVNIVLQMDTPGGVPPVATTPVAPPAADGAAAPAIPGVDPAAPAVAPAGPVIDPNSARITLSLTNVPMAEALRYICNLAGLKYKIDAYAVSVVPFTVVNDTLITKEYKVPPGIFSATSSAPTTAAVPAPAATAGAMTTAGSTTRVSAKDYFTGLGVLFGPGTAANYLPVSGRLIIKNTQEQLDLVDALVEAMTVQVPMQVDIAAKFVEITQNNLKELSFDTAIGDVMLGKHNGIIGGGSSGVASALPIPAPFIGAAPGLVTGADRSGVGAGGAISANAIDSLLYPASSGATPIVMSATGVFSEFQFSVMMKALDQKKGVDLLCSPRVTCKSGQEAEISVVREFKYATEYNPPQVPTSGSGSTTTLITVTPTTPTAFDVRQTGVILKVQPTVGSDGSTIDLQLDPQVVEFEGFINYGTPIYATNGFTRIELTDNVINQPIFSTRKVHTSVSVWDGQTVMLGGLVREDIQKVEDKIPFFGDVPVLGRLFRSSVDQHQKKNLVIFVTARLINPAGEAIVSDEDADDTKVDPILPSGDLLPPMPQQFPTK